MFGPEILARSLSASNRSDRAGNAWQYHSRSDHHSKLACWGVVFDLLRSCELLRRHAERGKVAFGINHEMRDFVHDRRKKLDLVICTPGGAIEGAASDFRTLAGHLDVSLSLPEVRELDTLPRLARAPVGSVLMALEAKACMTAHQRALPRLYDELNSSHLTIHGATDQAIAAAFVMINLAERSSAPTRTRATVRMRRFGASTVSPGPPSRS